MTSRRKAELLCSVLCGWAPVGPTSRSKLETYAQAGDAEGLWVWYQSVMKRRPDVGDSIERDGRRLSFEQLKPVMEAIHGLPPESEPF
jgi:hypothetical protein